MSTIKDLARETGLGLATISKYLNGGNVRAHNRAAIEAAIVKLNFTVNEFARGLKTNQSHTIGVLIPDLGNLFITTIITVAEDFLRKKGYGVLVCDCRTDETQEADAVRFLLSKRVDGIINMPVSNSGAHLRPALQAGLPVVLLDRMIPALQQNVSAVLADNVAAASHAVETLLQAGHRDIGVILGPRDIYTTQQRLLGYRRAMEQAGLVPDESRVLFSDYTTSGGCAAMRHLLGGTPPTAVFVTNYEMTLGAIIALNEAGVQMPQQLSLIGFDNMLLAGVVRPRLSVVTQPLEEIGHTAATLLLEQLEHKDRPPAPRIVTLKTGFLPGESVAQIPT